MIENIKLIGKNQTIEIDRTRTQNYVLDTVNVGDRDTGFSTIRTHDIIGLERDIWYKRLTKVQIVGYVIADHRDAESMERRKMRLNHFVVPATELTVVMDCVKNIKFVVTESVRYGATHTENNDAFCKFMITGIYRQ